MKIVQTIPQQQKEILLNSLNILESALKVLPENESKHYLDFDIKTLKSLLKYDLQVTLSKEQFGKFTSDNGIDFPEYIL